MNNAKLNIIIPNAEKNIEAIENQRFDLYLAEENPDIADPENIFCSAILGVVFLDEFNNLTKFHPVNINISYHLLPSVTVKLKK